MNGRITKLTPPKFALKRHNYRKALPNLRIDFEDRCAFSLKDIKEVGEVSIHVDHFDPRKKRDIKQDYKNLFPSLDHCNLSKLNYRPTSEDLKIGRRILNPRKEMDYDEQLVECLVSGELIGLNPTAIWHIAKLKLNAIFLCDARFFRTNRNKLVNQKFTVTTDLQQAGAFFQIYNEERARDIPVIRAATEEQVKLAVKRQQIKGTR